MIVVAVIGIALSVFAPMLTRRSPVERWDVVLESINDLVSIGQHEALTSRVMHRLLFLTKGEHHRIIIQHEEKDPEDPHKMVYKDTLTVISAGYTFPQSIQIKAVFWGTDEQLEQGKGQAFCYITPEGIVQQVLIHLVRKDQFDEVDDQVTIVMQPFQGQFLLVEGLRKPGAPLHEE